MEIMHACDFYLSNGQEKKRERIEKASKDLYI
jgi:hypothetical protein